MIKNIKILSISLLSILMLTLVGCGGSASNTPYNPTDNSTTNVPNNANTAVNTSTSDYEKFLSEKYNQYLGSSKLYNDYDIYADNFTYNGTNEEFIGIYNNSYADLKTGLESLKADLKDYDTKDNPDIQKYNENVITSIDKTIASIDTYTADFGTKAKDYATLSKDEMVKGLKDIGRAPYDARMELDKLIQDAKNTLGIK